MRQYGKKKSMRWQQRLAAAKNAGRVTLELETGVRGPTVFVREQLGKNRATVRAEHGAVVIPKLGKTVVAK